MYLVVVFRVEKAARQGALMQTRRNPPFLRTSALPRSAGAVSLWISSLPLSPFQMNDEFCYLDSCQGFAWKKAENNTLCGVPKVSHFGTTRVPKKSWIRHTKRVAK